MTESIADRYRRLSGAFADTVAAVPSDGWDRPTPCEDWSAHDLVAHVVQTQGMFLGFVGEDLSDGPRVDDDPVAAWAHASGAVQQRLDDPDRATATFQGFSGETTFEAACDRFLSADLVVHRWDLARSQGQDVALDAADMDRIQEGMAPLADQMRAPGAFGPEVEVPADADHQTRFLGFLGRQV
jgi:uncharacterized protein (TIGR03086 family)